MVPVLVPTRCCIVICAPCTGTSRGSSAPSSSFFLQSLTMPTMAPPTMVMPAATTVNTEVQSTPPCAGEGEAAASAAPTRSVQPTGSLRCPWRSTAMASTRYEPLSWNETRRSVSRTPRGSTSETDSGARPRSTRHSRRKRSLSASWHKTRSVASASGARGAAVGSVASAALHAGAAPPTPGAAGSFTATAHSAGALAAPVLSVASTRTVWFPVSSNATRRETPASEALAAGCVAPGSEASVVDHVTEARSPSASEHSARKRRASPRKRRSVESGASAWHEGAAACAVAARTRGRTASAKPASALKNRTPHGSTGIGGLNFTSSPGGSDGRGALRGLGFRLGRLGLALDLLEAEHVLALHLLQAQADEVARLLQLGDDLELQRVDAALGLLDLVEHLLHGGLDLGGLDDGLHERLVAVRGLVDAGARADEAVAALQERRADLLALDGGH